MIYVHKRCGGIWPRPWGGLNFRERAYVIIFGGQIWPMRLKILHFMWYVQKWVVTLDVQNFTNEHYNRECTLWLSVQESLPPQKRRKRHHSERERLIVIIIYHLCSIWGYIVQEDYTSTWYIDNRGAYPPIHSYPFHSYFFISTCTYIYMCSHTNILTLLHITHTLTTIHFTQRLSHSSIPIPLVQITSNKQQIRAQHCMALHFYTTNYERVSLKYW